MIVRCGLDEAVDRQIHAHGLGPGELAVVQVGLVHDLGDQADPGILDAKALDDGLERAVLAVMAEVGAEDIERDPLARRVGGVREAELRVRIAEALDEPGGGDAVYCAVSVASPRCCRVTAVRSGDGRP
jgi:hypothetical protein